MIAFELKGVKICPHGQEIPIPNHNECTSQTDSQNEINSLSQIHCYTSSFQVSKLNTRAKVLAVMKPDLYTYVHTHTHTYEQRG